MRGDGGELRSRAALDRVLGDRRERGRVVLDLRLEVAAFGALVLDPERHLERDAARTASGRGSRGAAGGSRRAEAEADAAHRLDPAGIAELAPERRDVHVDRLRRPVPARLPDLLEQPPAADRGARVARERGEQVELLRRQLELAAVELRAPRALVDLEAADAQRARVVRGAPTRAG